MWVLKLRLKPEKFFLGSLAFKYNVDMVGYPLSYSKDKKYLYLTTAGFMVGEESNKKALIRDIKKTKELVNLEVNRDFVILVTKQPLTTEAAYNPELIRPNPVFISRKGYLIWDIASWEKELLQKIIKFAKKYYGAVILKLKQEKLKNISFTSIMPELSKNQKQALDLAVSEGYYNYPKETDLHKLAKLMKVSYSTFQEHLKRAEGKVIPVFSK